jgi:hypothetical protein
MQSTPKGSRLHIGIFGRRNVGKSSLLNALTRQQVSIVSEVAGTTTDPVEKPMELLPIGPVLFIDTAGIDDVGALGNSAGEDPPGLTARTWAVGGRGAVGEFEEGSRGLGGRSAIVKFIKVRSRLPAAGLPGRLGGEGRCVATVARGRGSRLRRLVAASGSSSTPSVSRTCSAGRAAVLVVPIEQVPPRRLIQPQVQTFATFDGDYRQSS